MDGTRDPLFIRPAVLFSLAAVIVSAPSGAQSLGAFVPAGNMTATRSEHAATLLTDGRVLITGGSSGDVAGGVLKSTEIFDPSTDSFSPGPDMRDGRRMHSST